MASVAPTSGPARGGTAFTLTGTGFAAGATVTIGGVAVTGAVVASATSITGTTPAHGAGSAAIVVTNAGGQASSGSLSFAFVAAPAIHFINPGTLLLNGGPVLIDGSDFTSPVSVFFGGVPATSATVITANQLSATAPAHAAASVDVRVQNPDGQQASLAAGLTYSGEAPPPTATGAPTVASLSPTSGPDTGGTTVTLTGTNFDNATTVTFGGAPVTRGLVNTAGTSLSLVTSPHAAGAVDVAVSNSGSPAVTMPGAYTFLAPVVAPPVLASLSPTQGSSSGGTAVTLTGTGFDVASVTFGTSLATVQSSSATSILVATPAGTVGPVAVTVTNVDGSASTLPAAFTYTTPPPSVTSLSPAFGPAGVATNFTITGAGFQQGATVSVGGTPATNVAVVSDTSITATTPLLGAGPAAVLVVNHPGLESSFPIDFTFFSGSGLPPPVIAAMTPLTAELPGGQKFHLTSTGNSFLSGATVTFGGVPALAVTVDNTGAFIDGTIPPGAATGPTPVVVKNVDNQTATFSGFSYVNPAPGPLALGVEGAPSEGGTTLLIVAANLSPNATVTFGTVPSTNVAVAPGANGLSVLVPPSPPGAAADRFEDLVVRNPDGQSSTFPNFHRGPPPSITNVTPSGPTVTMVEGLTITVTGANFNPGASNQLQVSIAGVGMTVTSQTATQIVFNMVKPNKVLQAADFPVLVTNFDKQFGFSTQLLHFK